EVVGGRAGRASFDHRPVVVGEVAGGEHVDMHRTHRRVPIRGILRADDGTRVDVESRADLEALQIDLRTCAVQGDRFGHARAQTGERRLDGFHAVVGVFDADGVADLLPGAQL